MIDELSRPLILEENKSWVVVYKKAGQLSVPARTGVNDPRPVLGKILEVELKKQIYPVHRLDYEVSGIMIYAKTPEAQKNLNHCFEKHLVQKTYVAHSEFNSESKEMPLGIEQEWSSKIHRGKKRSFFADHGKEALTLATLVKKNSNHAVFILKPKTGRSHQLRLELSSRGYPIQNDVLYGAKKINEEPLIALEAIELCFQDSFSIFAESPAPQTATESFVFKVPPQFQRLALQ